MTTPGTTTIRVSVENRDRLQALIAADLPGASADEALAYLLDENWKAKTLADMDRFRRVSPEVFNTLVRSGADLDNATASDTEGTPE